MKILLFVLTSCSFGFFVIWASAPSSPPLSDEALRNSLMDSSTPGSLGAALLAIEKPLPAETRVESPGRALAGAAEIPAQVADQFAAELAKLPPEQQVAYAQKICERLEPHQFTERLQIIMQLDRTTPLPGYEDFLLSELSPNAIGTSSAPLPWKRAYASQLMHTYSRIKPGVGGKSQIDEVVSQTSDPELNAILTEAKAVVGGDAETAPVVVEVTADQPPVLPDE